MRAFRLYQNGAFKWQLTANDATGALIVFRLQGFECGLHEIYALRGGIYRPVII